MSGVKIVGSIDIGFMANLSLGLGPWRVTRDIGMEN